MNCSIAPPETAASSGVLPARSRHRTRTPSATNDSTRWLPMNPREPVTMAIIEGGGRRAEGGDCCLSRLLYPPSSTLHPASQHYVSTRILAARRFPRPVDLPPRLVERGLGRVAVECDRDAH